MQVQTGEVPAITQSTSTRFAGSTSIFCRFGRKNLGQDFEIKNVYKQELV